MRRRVIDPAGFEARFRETIDPWDYATSPFEAWKRSVLLHACGPGPFGRALELACAIGETTRVLAPRCLRLDAVDSSQTAVVEAARRTRGLPNVRLSVALLPEEMPRGPFDLIVASEILYYLPERPFRRLLERVEAALAPGGRVVLLHHLRPFDDAAILPRRAQALAIAALGRRLRFVRLANAGRFQAAALCRGSGLGSRAGRAWPRGCCGEPLVGGKVRVGPP